MREQTADRAALDRLNPTKMLAYLRAQGWHIVETQGDRAYIVSRRSEHAPMDSDELLLPARRNLGDYFQRMAELIAALAEIEDRSQASILADVEVSDRDVIRLRATGLLGSEDLSLEDGVEFFAAAQKLILSAACAAVEPRPAYHLGKVSEARDYLRSVRLGQTERGSYIVTVLSPVDPVLGMQQALPGLDSEPFSRRVTLTLEKAMRRLRAAIIETSTLGAAAFTNATGHGVSANLCEATAALIEHGGGLDTKITWARTRPSGSEAGPWVRFEASEAPILRSAAKEILSREPLPEQSLSGSILSVMRSAPDREFDGRATLLTTVDGRPRRVRMQFPHTEFDTVLAAIRSGWVSVTGDLVQSGSRFELRQPRNLRLLNVDEDDAGDVENSG